MTLKVYEYKGCGTCRKALKFLDEKKVSYEKIAIREKPPTKAELKVTVKLTPGFPNIDFMISFLHEQNQTAHQPLQRLARIWTYTGRI